jgi:hypothetical protein
MQAFDQFMSELTHPNPGQPSWPLAPEVADVDAKRVSIASATNLLNATQTSNATNARSALVHDIMGEFSGACVTLQGSLTSGVLIYAPLAAAYIAQGAVAGLHAAIVAGPVAALVASSSFIITSPSGFACPPDFAIPYWQISK